MITVLEQTWIRTDYDGYFERAIEWLLIGLLAFMPLAFGVVQAWSEEAVILLVAAVSVCFCLRLILASNPSITWTWACLPVAVFILVAVVQIIPLPVTLVRLISPQTAAQKLELLSHLDGSAGPGSSMAISFYACATRHDLRLVLAAAAVFFVTLNTMRRPDQIARLLGAIVVIGGAIAALAIVQATLGNGKLYWLVPSPHGVVRSGPFVNHGHFAQFMNLSIGAAFGLILMRLHRVFGGRPVTPALVAEYIASREGRILLGLMLVIVLGVTSVFVSLSRGGMISTMIAGTFTILILGLARSMKGSGWILALLALMAFVCILYVGFDAVYDRLGTLGELDRAQGGRWQVVKDVAVAWTRFPIMGTGLGTHEVVYPMFDRATVAAIASHAENEYAQTAEETGILGLLAMTVLVVIVWRSYLRILRTPYAPIHAVAFGLGFGLMAVMVHSLSDFGQHIPANGFLSVIFCALLIRLTPVRRNDRAGAGRGLQAGGAIRRWGIVGLVVVCVVFGWALHGADAARRGAGHWTQALATEADLTRRDWQADPEEYASLIRHAQDAAEAERDNITYRYWLPVYRWRAISGGADPNMAQALRAPKGREFVVRIVAELQEACACCPTFGPTWSVLGQLERFVLDPTTGEDHIRMGYELAPCDPTTCLVAGNLDVEMGHLEQALAKLQRAVKLDASVYPEVATLLVNDLKRPDLALEIAGEQPRLAGQLARMLDDDTEFAREVDRKLLTLLEQKCREQDAPPYWHAMLADMLRRQGKAELAIQCYQKALNATGYGQVQWRLKLAQLLADQGRVAEAVREARMCLRLSPDLPAAERLLGKLSAAQIPQGDAQ